MIFKYDTVDDFLKRIPEKKKTARNCSLTSLTYPSSEWYITCPILVTGAYSEPRQISKMKLFSRIVHVFQPLTIFAKDFISDVRLGSEYISALYRNGGE